MRWKFKIDRSRLIKGSKESMYVSKVIVMPIIMQTRLSKPETIKFRSDLGFNQIDLILKKRTIIINTAIKRIFCRKNRASTQSLKNERVWTYLFFWA